MVLKDKLGLINSFVLDAGWQDTESVFRPRTEVSGPGDNGLIEISEVMKNCGFKLGLWCSWNGPIGICDRWAEDQGFRVSGSGNGAIYTCDDGKLRYVCLTDAAWEKALGDRLEELVQRVPVDFLKLDWDNEGIEDPALFPDVLPLKAQMWEANIAVIIRLLQRVASKRPSTRFRGGWWASPWWLSYVDNTFLPHSGDSEAADLPSLTQREALITSRDTFLHHHFVTCRTPIPWDVMDLHETASASRNPIQDTDESWLNNLIMWVSRGTHYLQLYMPPYSLRGWRAWTLRETLRWFRENEELLWKSPMRMVGGSPGDGEIYGYMHEGGAQQLLVLRNPMGHPQRSHSAKELGLIGKWTRLFPSWENWDFSEEWMPSHAVWIFAREGKTREPKEVLLCGETGWLVPARTASLRSQHGLDEDIPDLHRISKNFAILEDREKGEASFHADLPFGLNGAEWIIEFEWNEGQEARIRAASGRYSDVTSSAPTAITWLQSHWRIGDGQQRMGMKPFNPRVAIARIAIGVGGATNLFLKSDGFLPPVSRAWLEISEMALPAEGNFKSSPNVPPSQIHRKSILFSYEKTP